MYDIHVTVWANSQKLKVRSVSCTLVADGFFEPLIHTAIMENFKVVRTGEYCAVKFLNNGVF